MPVGLVVCLLRHHDDETNLAVARAAAAAAGNGVVGLDVAGDELLYPSIEPYREPYQIAAAAGLGLTAHAAEAGPARRRRRGRRDCSGVTRIGHGSHIADDPAVLAWAAARASRSRSARPPTSTPGAARSLREHPLHAFLAAGCRVVLGDDNPIHDRHAGSSEEERRLVAEGGLTAEQLARDPPHGRRGRVHGRVDRRALRERFAARAPEPVRPAAAADPPPLDRRAAVHDDRQARPRPRSAAASQFTTPSWSQRQRAPTATASWAWGTHELGAAEDVDDVERAGRGDRLARASRKAGTPRTLARSGLTGTQSKPWWTR